MAVAPLLMIGGSMLAGYIGSKLGGKKKATEPAQVAAATDPATATPAEPMSATQATSEATKTATTTAERTRRRSAAGNSGVQSARGRRSGPFGAMGGGLAKTLSAKTLGGA